MIPNRALPLAATLLITATTLGAQSGPCRWTGRYEVQVAAGSQTIPGRLELGCLDGKHWGRLALVLRDSLIGAMYESGTTGDTIDFRMGGGLSGFRLVPGADTSRGVVMVGRPFPITAVRVGPVDPSLEAHSALHPWDGVATDPDSGLSYPVAVDGETMVFTQHGRRLTRQRLMVASKGATGWTVRPLTTPADDAASERGPALLPGGRGIVFATTRRLEGDTAVSSRFRLFTIERRGHGWSEPEPFAAAASIAGDGAQQPAVTQDGALYFSSDRPEGLGGRDIYRLDPGAAAPVALGGPTSSAGDEHGAWVSAEGDLMLVAGGGGRTATHGGDDLYWSERTAEGWSEPRLLPVPINSFGNEYGASLSADRRTLWLTSDRFGIARLYRVDLAAHGVTLPAAPRQGGSHR
ncbi:MAG: hypothetical protein AB7R55_14145 [Gemmatimonadales bacterium]